MMWCERCSHSELLSHNLCAQDVDVYNLFCHPYYYFVAVVEEQMSEAVVVRIPVV